MRKFRWVIGACALTLGIPAYAVTLYSVIDLGATPDHYGFIDLRSISENGQVLGDGGTRYGDRAWVWSQKDGFRELGNLGYSGPIETGAAENNNSGQVVGWSFTDVPGRSGQRPHAFLYDPRHGMQDISVLAGKPGEFNYATGINSNGTVIGWGSFGETMRGFVWRKNEPMRILGDLSGGMSLSRSTAISDRGHVVGTSAAPTGVRAFLWTERRGMADIGSGTPRDVNERGQVVGSNGGQGFLWSARTGMTALSNLRGGQDYGSAAAINNRGTVVGRSVSPEGTEPVVWFDGDIYRLKDLIHPMDPSYGVNLRGAVDVNERGQILVGSPQWPRLGYILTPWKPGAVRRPNRTNASSRSD